LENQYSTKIIEKVNCLDGFIKVSGGCNVEKDGDKCKYSWPRISSISLEEHVEADKPPTVSEIED